MKIPATIILCCFAYASLAQTTALKDEILAAWTVAEKDSSKHKHPANLTDDQKLNARIVSAIKNLGAKNIDTFILYVSAHPGYSNTSDCLDYAYPIFCHILWPRNDTLHMKLIKGKCEFNLSKPDSPAIFSFYRNNKDTIQEEEVMPVITGRERNKDGTVSYFTKSSNHEAEYILFIHAGSMEKRLRFSQYGLRSTESLFYEHNLHLKSIELWKMIRKQTDNLR